MTIQQTTRTASFLREENAGNKASRRTLARQRSSLEPRRCLPYVCPWTLYEPLDESIGVYSQSSACPDINREVVAHRVQQRPPYSSTAGLEQATHSRATQTSQAFSAHVKEHHKRTEVGEHGPLCRHFQNQDTYKSCSQVCIRET